MTRRNLAAARHRRRQALGSQRSSSECNRRSARKKAKTRRSPWAPTRKSTPTGTSQQPDNGVTNFRGFDNRDATFTITNVALDAQWDDGSTVGRVALQVGHTPSTYYLAEPSLPGTAGANATNGELWKYVQQAYVGNRFGEEEDLLATAGVFLSPIGPEGIAIKDNWNWSRSNLFFALPFYHTGLRAAKTIDDRWTATAGVVNGWNSVVDNNRDKSVFGQITWSEADHLTASALYFGGVERGEGAPEGSPWRHSFDAHATWNATIAPRAAGARGCGLRGQRLRHQLVGRRGRRGPLSSGVERVRRRTRRLLRRERRLRTIPARRRRSSFPSSGFLPSPEPWSTGRASAPRGASRFATTKPRTISSSGKMRRSMIPPGV